MTASARPCASGLVAPRDVRRPREIARLASFAIGFLGFGMLGTLFFFRELEANRTLRDSRDLLTNLLAWMMGGNNVRFLIVFDGQQGGGRDEPNGRVQIQYSRPPETADDVIRHIVEKRIGGDEEITVVTSDIEVARHARAMGADISLGDLFLASAFGSVGSEASDKPGTDAASPADDKPLSLSKKELAEWAELFTRRRTASEGGGTGADADDDGETVN